MAAREWDVPKPAYRWQQNRQKFLWDRLQIDARREMTGSGAEMWSWDEHSKASVCIYCTPRTSLWLDSDVPDTQPDEPEQRHIGSKASFIDRLRRTVPQLRLPVFTFISINTYRLNVKNNRQLNGDILSNPILILNSFLVRQRSGAEYLRGF